MKFARLASSGLLASGIAVAGFSVPAPATAAACIQKYAECLFKASDLSTWWQRSAAGIDCYLDTVACLRNTYG